MYLDFLYPYTYNRAPEGQDPLGKFISVTKWGLFTGLAGGAWRACFYYVDADHKEVIRVVTRALVPCVGMSAAFTTTVFAATNIRGKDDPLNYSLGALAASGIFYSCTGHQRQAVLLAFYSSILAYCYKTFALEGEYFLKKPTHTRYFSY